MSNKNLFSGSGIVLPVVFASLLFLFTVTAAGAPGDLDLTFNGTGKVVKSFTDMNDYAEDIAIQSDGKIVAAGVWYDSGTQSFVVARFNADGTVDSSFGTGGRTVTSFGTTVARAGGVAIQPDGKIVVCGFADSGVIPGSFALARYLPDGSLDPSFSDDGKVTTPFNSDAVGAYDVLIEYDGKIVAVGTVQNDFATVRYNSDGSLDNTFGTGGKVITSIRSQADIAYSVKAQPDGKLLVAGFTTNGSETYFALVRYRYSGALDRTFNLDGKLTTSFGHGLAYAFDVDIDSGGRVIAGGVYSTSASFSVCALTRYTSKGLPDPFFDGDGMLTLQAGTRNGTIYDVSVQPDDKIIAGGEMRDIDQNNNSNSFLMRLKVDGSLDSAFGMAGKVQTALSPQNDGILGTALQSDGKIVTGGFAVDAAKTEDFALARYLNDGSPVPRTGGERKSLLTFTPASKPFWLR